MARTTYSTALVLQAIGSGHRYGFDIMDATGLPSGTVYPALRRLERDGLLASRWEDEAKAHADQRPARRYYRLAQAGERALEAAIERFPALRHSMAPHDVVAPSPQGRR